MNQKTKKVLINIVGEENYTDNLIDLISYSKDASEHSHRPDAAVWPTTTEQISAILKLANKEKFPVVARGAGTSLAGLAVPEKGGVILDLGRMNKIISISVEDRLAVVQPGVVYAELERALSPHGFFFPPDPASSPAATIGGMVNTNAAGNRTIKYGPTRNFVLWMEVVLPDGKVINTGSKTLKSCSDYDLTRLIVGSEGSLGVVTKIALKAIPVPQHYATANFIYDSVVALARAATRLRRAGLVPEMIEFLDRKTAKTSFDYAGISGVPFLPPRQHSGNPVTAPLPAGGQTGSWDAADPSGILAHEPPHRAVSIRNGKTRDAGFRRHTQGNRQGGLGKSWNSRAGGGAQLGRLGSLIQYGDQETGGDRLQ